MQERYRILEAKSELGWRGFGVAYEKSGQVLLFVPECRGAQTISVESIDKLNSSHWPSTEREFNWHEVQAWEGDTSFYPNRALNKHILTIGERREMKTQPLSQNEFETFAAPQNNVSLSQRLLPAIAVVLAIVLVGAALGLFWKLAHPSLAAVEPGEPVYIRDIYILLDSTKSMSPANIAAAKDIIKSRIFPNLGPGDRVFAYGIGAGFIESRDRIFGEKALPGVPENLLNQQLVGRIPPEVIDDVWRQVPEGVEDWTRRLDDVNTKAEYLRLSSYFAAFSYLKTRLEAPKDHSLRERRLIVIGDLYQDPLPKPFKPPAATPAERNAFSDIEVQLIFPYQADKKEPLQPDQLKQFWKDYFAQRGNDHVLVTSFDDPTPLLSSSPVPTGKVKRRS